MLANVLERDKWRRRLAVLEGALREVRERERRVTHRLKRLRKEVARARVLSESMGSARARLAAAAPGSHGGAPPTLPPR